MASADGIDSCQESVSTVSSRLRMFEDFNLAFRLQDAEFGQHYALNRAERQLVGNDTKRSKAEQEKEARIAAVTRRQQLETIAANDAYIAWKLQEELEKEERCAKQRIAELDAEYARALESREKRKLEEKRRAEIEAADEQYARELQEYYKARSEKKQNNRPRKAPSKPLSIIPSFVSKTKKLPHITPNTRTHSSSESGEIWSDAIDERTQNELNAQMASAAISQPGWNEPPPAYSSLDHYIPNRDYPLATIATRDSSSPVCIEHFSGNGSHSFVNQRPSDPYENAAMRTANNTQLLRNRIAREEEQAAVIAPSLGNTASSTSVDLFVQQDESSPISVATKIKLLNSVSQKPAQNSASSGTGSINISEVTQMPTACSNDLLNRLHPTNPFLPDLMNTSGDSGLDINLLESVSPTTSNVPQRNSLLYK